MMRAGERACNWAPPLDATANASIALRLAAFAMAIVVFSLVDHCA